MNTPIINPWVIYLINVCDNLKSLFATIIFVAIVVAILLGVYWVFMKYDGDMYYDEEDVRDMQGKAVKGFKIAIIALACSSILVTALPNEKTCYTMLVTSQLTEENIHNVGNNAKEVVDYIFEKIQEVQSTDQE